MTIAVPKRQPASNTTEDASTPERMRDKREQALDEGLEEPFPASDPVAAVQPRPREPDTVRKHHSDES